MPPRGPHTVRGPCVRRRCPTLNPPGLQGVAIPRLTADAVPCRPCHPAPLRLSRVLSLAEMPCPSRRATDDDLVRERIKTSLTLVGPPRARQHRAHRTDVLPRARRRVAPRSTRAATRRRPSTESGRFGGQARCCRSGRKGGAARAPCRCFNGRPAGRGRTDGRTAGGRKGGRTDVGANAPPYGRPYLPPRHLTGRPSAPASIGSCERAKRALVFVKQ